MTLARFQFEELLFWGLRLLALKCFLNGADIRKVLGSARFAATRLTWQSFKTDKSSLKSECIWPHALHPVKFFGKF